MKFPGIFSKSSKKKKDDNKSKDGNSREDLHKNRKSKYHTKHKTSSLVTKMKLDESVPSTISDAIHGDASALNSNDDFARIQPLELNGKTYYPVLILDDETLDDAGLSDNQNKDALGQISVGLKISTSASGCLPIVTKQSLEGNYFGIVPMHDSFEFLKAFPVVENYARGWLVGLLNIDNDELHLSKTNLRLNIHQWNDFVYKKLEFEVVNGKVRFTTSVPTNSDPLHIDNEEKDDTSDNNYPEAEATREFDDDDEPASNSEINHFVNGDSDESSNSASAAGYNPSEMFNQVNNENTSNDSDDSEGWEDNNGNVEDSNNSHSSVDVSPSQKALDQSRAALSQMQSDNDKNDDFSTGSQASYASTAYRQASLDSNNNDNVSDSNNDINDVNNNNDKTGDNVNSNLSNSNDSQKPESQTLQSRDELEASKLINDNSIKTLDDIDVSISNKQFIESYVNMLRVDPLPLDDETNDPTGKIHYLNSVKREYNASLNSKLNSDKAYLRQWFDQNSSSILTELRNKIHSKDSNTSKANKKLDELKAKLNDEHSLRLQAQQNMSDQLDDIDAAFNKDLKDAQQAALAEVNRQFQQKRVNAKNDKETLITKGIGQIKQQISSQIIKQKAKIRDISQTVASKSYNVLMLNGGRKYTDKQSQLNNLRDSYLSQFNELLIKGREDENKRVQNEADKSRTSTTVASLTQQNKELRENNAQKIQSLREEYEHKIEALQTSSSNNQQNAVAEVQAKYEDKIKDLSDNNETLQSKYDEIYNKYDSTITHLNEKISKMSDKHYQELQKNYDKSDKDINKARRSSMFSIIIVAICGSFFGLALGGGLSFFFHNNGNNNTNTTPTTSVPAYMYPQQQQPQSSTNTTQSNSSNANGNSSNDDSNTKKNNDHKANKSEKKHNDDKSSDDNKKNTSESSSNISSSSDANNDSNQNSNN